MSLDNTNFSNRALVVFIFAAIIIAWNFKNWLMPLGLGILLILVVKINLIYNLKIIHKQDLSWILQRILREEFIGQILMSVIFMYLSYSFGLWTKPIYETVRHYFA